jgi:hypothetical protein
VAPVGMLVIKISNVSTAQEVIGRATTQGLTTI